MNPFSANAPFHFCIPWKRQKTWRFQGVQNWRTGLKWVKSLKLDMQLKRIISKIYTQSIISSYGRNLPKLKYIQNFG